MHPGSWALVATVVIHGGLAATVATLPASTPPPPPTVITVREVPRERAVPPPPPPPPQAPPPPAVAAALAPAPPQRAKPPPRARPASPAPAATAPPPSTTSAPADFGVRLGNSAGGDGAAVPAPRAAAAEPPAPPKRKILAAAPAAPAGCAEAIVKPKPISVVQPAFTQEAREAQLTGKVRVEITISASGAVTSAKVIAGLGYGLDEAALEAARASSFTPATRCGEPVETTFTIGMRFQ